MKKALIKTENEYRKFVEKLEELCDLSKPSAEEKDEIDFLMLLLDKYEQDHYKLKTSDPIRAIQFAMEQRRLKPVDIAKELGGASRASKILNYQEYLTLEMIRKLETLLNIPLNTLVQKYSLHAKPDKVKMKPKPVSVTNPGIRSTKPKETRKAFRIPAKGRAENKNTRYA